MNQLLTEIIKCIEDSIGNCVDKERIVQLMEKIPETDDFSLPREALHQLYHYITDKDIRDRDSEYNENFTREMNGYSSELQRKVNMRPNGA